MKTTKNIPFNKNQVIVNKDTFDTMNKIVKESKKVVELQLKINEVFNEINSYASGYKTLENENKNIKREVQVLEYKNNQLEKENNKLNEKIKRVIIKAIKQFFRKLLLNILRTMLKQKLSNITIIKTLKCLMLKM